MPLLPDLLQRSCFYPCCGTDIRPVLALHGRVDNFVYADYWSEVRREFPKLIEDMGTHGFRLLRGQELFPEELWGGSVWPGSFDRGGRHEVSRGIWDVDPWGALLRFDGPRGEVQILMLGTEAIAAYRETYVACGVAPVWLALLRPGCGLGGGWTDFWFDDPFREAMQANRGGLPIGILCDDYRPYPPDNLGIAYREVPLPDANPLLDRVQAFRRLPGWRDRHPRDRRAFLG